MENVFSTLGMFIIDEFEHRDSDGNLQANHPQSITQLGGGGTYAAIGARIFLPPQQIRMVIDHGSDLPSMFLEKLLSFGQEMWLFRKRQGEQTTRALNKYIGQHRGFEYLTPRIRLTPKDLAFGPNIPPASYLHFICSPTRAIEIISEIKEIIGWNPITIYEPIPDRCVPEELPALKKILSEISILSPNAEEALSLLGNLQTSPTRASIELAAQEFLRYGIGEGKGSIIIRSGGLGACVAKYGERPRWVNAYWEPHNARDHNKIIDVTGAGNAFLGGLSAGLHCTQDIFEATFYASIAASFVVEQFGLPDFQATSGLWNGEDPKRRLQELRARH